jgi:hypothetical protein
MARSRVDPEETARNSAERLNTKQTKVKRRVVLALALSFQLQEDGRYAVACTVAAACDEGGGQSTGPASDARRRRAPAIPLTATPTAGEKARA